MGSWNHMVWFKSQEWAGPPPNQGPKGPMTADLSLCWEHKPHLFLMEILLWRKSVLLLVTTARRRINITMPGPVLALCFQSVLTQHNTHATGQGQVFQGPVSLKSGFLEVLGPAPPLLSQNTITLPRQAHKIHSGKDRLSDVKPWWQHCTDNGPSLRSPCTALQLCHRATMLISAS